MDEETNYYYLSPLETKFHDDCRMVGVKVIPQYPIGKIHADYAIPERNLAIELDSAQWHSSPEAIANDRKRDEIYKSYGWKVLRIKGGVVFAAGEELAFRIKKGKYDEGGTIYHIDDPLEDDIYYGLK